LRSTIGVVDLGDMVVKRRLEGILNDIIRPIRERRAVLARDPDFVMDVPLAGTAIACDVTATTQAEGHAGLGLFTWSSCESSTPVGDF
jgi:tryptophanyl-tRNA synthetase